MKRGLLALVCAAVIASTVSAQETGIPAGVHPQEYIAALSEVQRLDTAGDMNALMEHVFQPSSSSALRAYADWLKRRIMETNTRNPLYHWAYAHLLRLADVRDTSALMYVTAVLLLETETARCADQTATLGRQYVGLLMQSELQKNYWAQPPEVRQQARQFALKHEEIRRQGTAAGWPCLGGMEEIRAALAANDAASPKRPDKDAQAIEVPPHAPSWRSAPEFDQARNRARQAFTSYFSDERNAPAP